ncbi:MAG: NADAR domain-containing protein [Propioniciclava sp.]
MFWRPTDPGPLGQWWPSPFRVEHIEYNCAVQYMMAEKARIFGDHEIEAQIGAYIGAAYWFTSSTSFANPAVTIGRVFTDTFAGIAPASVLPFLAAQLAGATLGAGTAVLLFGRPHPGSKVVAASSVDTRA